MMRRSNEVPRTFTGHYTRPDDQVTYDYSITIAPSEGGSVYFSRVAIGDALRGRPSGSVKHRILDDAKVNEAVRSLIEAAIRDRDGVN